MKKIIILMMLLIMPLGIVKAAGSIKTNTSSLTIEPGKSKTFKITASSSAGRVDISSSNTAVATVSSKSQFLDNSSVTIKVTAKKEGTAVINVKLTDVATYDGKTLTGTKTVKITVKKAEPKPPVVPVVKEMNITRLEVIGYDIVFSKDKHEYTVDIDENVKKVYIAAAGENAKVTGAGEVSITDKNSVKVSFQNTTKAEDVKEYTISFNKVGKENPETITKEVIKEVEVEKKTNKVHRGFMYATIILGVLCLLLLLKNTVKLEKKAVASESITNISLTPVDPMAQNTIQPKVDSNVDSQTDINDNHNQY